MVAPTRYDLADLRPVYDEIRATHQMGENLLGDPDHQFMDVRWVAEYTAECFWPSLPPEGHQRGGYHCAACVLRRDRLAAEQARRRFRNTQQHRVRSPAGTARQPPAVPSGRTDRPVRRPELASYWRSSPRCVILTASPPA
jgi:hypothetical protein